MSPCTYILLSSLAILNYLNLLEFGSCLGLVTYLVRGKVQEWEGFAIIVKSTCNQRMAYFNILFNYLNKILISSFLEIDFEINISDKKSRRFDLAEVIFKCIKVL